MELALDFINFCDNQQFFYSEYGDQFERFVMYLRNYYINDDFWAFNALYNAYIIYKKIETPFNKTHFDLCKFLAYTYYDDLACNYEELKNNSFYKLFN
jgi:hypothetical protein